MLKSLQILSNNMKNQYIAPCGVDCESCDIRKMPFDSESAKKVIPWCRSQGWIKQEEGLTEMMERNMYCEGCRNRDGIQWNSECLIYPCCVEDKKLEYCSDCSEFLCAKLEEWGKQSKSHGEAIEKLKKMRI